MYRMLKYSTLIMLAVMFVSCRTRQAVESSFPLQAQHIEQEHSPDVFLVMYDKETGREPLLKAIKEFQCEIVYDYNFINGMALKKPDAKSLEDTMQFFRGVKGVLTVEYNHIIRLTDPVRPRLEIR